MKQAKKAISFTSTEGKILGHFTKSLAFSFFRLEQMSKVSEASYGARVFRFKRNISKIIVPLRFFRQQLHFKKLENIPYQNYCYLEISAPYLKLVAFTAAIEITTKSQKLKAQRNIFTDVHFTLNLFRF